MRGRRPGKTGGVFAGIHRGFFRAENDADGRESFAAVERPMSDRLLVCLRSRDERTLFCRSETGLAQIPRKHRDI
jgi:hypothetical protein